MIKKKHIYFILFKVIECLYKNEADITFISNCMHLFDFFNIHVNMIRFIFDYNKIIEFKIVFIDTFIVKVRNRKRICDNLDVDYIFINIFLLRLIIIKLI